jgi:hypothetical protein
MSPRAARCREGARRCGRDASEFAESLRVVVGFSTLLDTESFKINDGRGDVVLFY